MEHTYATWAMILMGLGAVAAGVVGIVLPAGQRLSVLLALVIGAGVGVAALFLQLLPAEPDVDDGARAFLIASALGLAAVLAASAVLLRRSRAGS
jgi:hypothetical protein